MNQTVQEYRCSVCRHHLVHAINADLLTGPTVRAVAEAYSTEKHSLSKSAVQRHKTECMQDMFAAAAEEARIALMQSEASRDEARAKTLDEQTRRILNGTEMADIISETVKDLKMLRDRVMTDIRENKQGAKITDAVSVLDRLLKSADSYSKLSAEFRERERIREETIIRDWNIMKNTMLKWLDPYPEAKEGFLNDISRLGSSVFN